MLVSTKLVIAYFVNSDEFLNLKKLQLTIVSNDALNIQIKLQLHHFGIREMLQLKLVYPQQEPNTN